MNASFDTPFEEFRRWLEAARRHREITDPTAMCLATATAKGQPSARIVLLKECTPRGFVFYTNLGSRKSLELQENPQASLCFYWMPLQRQVRITGNVEPVEAVEADAYFASRPRESQIGAWASEQSKPLESREALMKKVEKFTAQFAGERVPRPSFWSGWRVAPQEIEFWVQGEFRLHERTLYTRAGEGWKVVKLYP